MSLDINNLIETTLKPTDLPISFQVHSGVATTYITYTEYLGQAETFSDDEDETEGHYVQINVYSKENYNNIVKQVKALMKKAGFGRTTEINLYENDTKLFHKGIRYFYEENLI